MILDLKYLSRRKKGSPEGADYIKYKILCKRVLTFVYLLTVVVMEPRSANIDQLGLIFIFLLY